MAAFMAAVFALGLRGVTGDGVSPEQYATDFVTLLPFGYAFSAGVVASVNPCGFLMLPAFAGYYMGVREGPAGDVTARALGRAAMLGVMATLGFVVLFTIIGSVVSAGGGAVVDVFPWAGLAVGVGMALLGAWLLVTGRSIGIAWAGRLNVPGVRPGSRGPASRLRLWRGLRRRLALLHAADLPCGRRHLSQPRWIPRLGGTVRELRSWDGPRRRRRRLGRGDAQGRGDAGAARPRSLRAPAERGLSRRFGRLPHCPTG